MNLPDCSPSGRKENTRVHKESVSYHAQIVPIAINHGVVTTIDDRGTSLKKTITFRVIEEASGNTNCLTSNVRIRLRYQARAGTF